MAPPPTHSSKSAQELSTSVPQSLPDFNALVPDHLNILDGLPSNLKYLFSKISDLQHDLDDCLDSIHEQTTAITSSMHNHLITSRYHSAEKWDIHLNANLALSHLAGAPIHDVQRLADKKVELATCAYDLVDQCILKLDMELKAAGLPVQEAYPVILAAVANASINSPAHTSIDTEASINNTLPSTLSLESTSGSVPSLPTVPSLPILNIVAQGDAASSENLILDTSTETNNCSPLIQVEKQPSSKDVDPQNNEILVQKGKRKYHPPESVNEARPSDSISESCMTPHAPLTPLIDPNEPLYCICQSVAHGEMVACDDTECPYEWFHYSCVGLKKAPKGLWYCSECTPKHKRLAAGLRL